jgi:hypothetical protein
MSESDPRRVPRRPAYLTPEALEALGGSYDPTDALRAAHATAAVLVHTGRANDDPELTSRLVDLVDEIGLSTVAELWSGRPARTLPGALWRLYVLHEWVRRAPEEASREYAAGVRFTAPNHVVAGAAEPPGPEEVSRVSNEILRGVFDGELDVALERAAAFCRVVSAGRADLGEGESSAEDAAHVLAMATDLSACAALWRDGELD